MAQLIPALVKVTLIVAAGIAATISVNPILLWLKTRVNRLCVYQRESSL